MKKLSKYLLLVFCLVGCASNMNIGGKRLSSCSNRSCTSVREAYNATNHYTPASQNHKSQISEQISPFLPKTIPNLSVINEPKPILVPIKVLRVWINAYQDNSGNLVYPTKVFTQVTPSTWNIGYSAKKAIKSSTNISPLIVKEKIVKKEVNINNSLDKDKELIDKTDAIIIPTNF